MGVLLFFALQNEGVNLKCPTPFCIWSESAMSSKAAAMSNKAAAAIYCGGRILFQRLRLLCIGSESAEKVNGCGEGPGDGRNLWLRVVFVVGKSLPSLVVFSIQKKTKKGEID
ncbi:unnamed protein product [Lactuca virosa]|uniref:Uncharacterized protein n=1 Tax=Lactuca virosa TaxID=75947 RepID=A0AAU9NM71_9ASTR|nr:unnamed protein product [Lactuca virosa]